MDANLRRWVALVVVCFGQLMIMLDSTIVNVALPSIQHDLHFTQAGLTWVVNAYLITYGSFLLVAGRAGDLIGRRKVFLAGVLLFTAASVASGFSSGVEGLIVGRFLQGVGGSLSAGVIIAIIVTEFPRPVERAQAMSVFTFTIAAGGSLGLLAGGMLTQWVNWHWIFFINVPIGVVTLVLGLWLINENQGLGLRQGLDIAGAVLITAAMSIGVYAIVTAADAGWTSLHTLGLGGIALALLGGFVVLESRVANPLVPLRIFRLRSLTGATAVRAFVFAGMFANFFIGALYLQHIKGMSAIQIGLAFLPMTLVLGAFSAGITVRLMGRFGARNVATAGLFAILAALFLLSRVDEQTPYFPNLVAAYLLFGLGGGIAFMPLVNIAMSEVPVVDAGLASGFSNLTMQIGGAIGLAVLGTISSGRTASLISQDLPLAGALTGGYQLAFLIAAGSVAIALLLMVSVLRPTATARRVEVLQLERDEAEPEVA
jgi:EmrB/QacA subfamily drug resistance transporter